MIREAHGNLLEADVDALVNTVNTVGIMGKGIALQFKRAYPEMFASYATAANAGRVRIGRMHVHRIGALVGPRFIINFPTKEHWRARSEIQDIRAGLADLVRVIERLDIRSVAVPPLGCGNGGLSWGQVQPLITQAFQALPDVEAHVYPPAGPPPAAVMPDNTERPAMTVGRAAMVEAVDRYEERTTDVSLIEVQKLMYFLQAAGQDLHLRFEKSIYGPYADDLRRVIRLVEGHFLSGFGDASASLAEAEPITVLPGAAQEARSVLDHHPATWERIGRVLALVEGFESTYAMELLATVHCTAGESAEAATNPAEAARLVAAWSPRKARMNSVDHVTTAWRHLHDQGWLRAPVAV